MDLLCLQFVVADQLQVKGAHEEQAAVFEEIRVFRARGSRPLQVVSYRQPGESLNITALMRQAEKGTYW